MADASIIHVPPKRLSQRIPDTGMNGWGGYESEPTWVTTVHGINSREVGRKTLILGKSCHRYAHDPVENVVLEGEL
jgi:hypothetical protein